MNYEVKIPAKDLAIKFEGFGLAEKREIVFLVFHTNASKFIRER